MAMVELQLKYDPSIHGVVRGWYLPCTNIDAWIAAWEQEPDKVSSQYFLAPRTLAQREPVGLIALRCGDRESDEALTADAPSPAGTIPLVVFQDPSRKVELWLPMFATVAQNISIDELLSKQNWDGASRLIWLPPDETGLDRLIRLEVEDEIDLSVLIKPATRSAAAAATEWIVPPRIHHLPEQVTGLIVSQELQGPNLFIQEQDEIGGDSDQLMSIDDNGRPKGGNLFTQTGRWYRLGLTQLISALQSKLNRQPGSEQERKQADESKSKRARSPAVKSQVGRVSTALLAKLQKMLANQREKQMQKLLALFAKDPDRALKYAVPMSMHGEPRGRALPGSRLIQQNTDFSLARLFGGGMPFDVWNLNSLMRSRLLETYRSQVDRELAAGRYRRAAYIYAHLLGDLVSAAQVLEKGKFFLEAASLYKHLKRSIDQARCLQNSGQLSEAAEIYEQLGDFESAAKMWRGVGNYEAERSAYERAFDAALRSGDVLRAARILETHLGDPVRADQLLWQQWPRGHQVMDCMRLAFGRLAEQGRVSEAHRHLDEIVSVVQAPEQTMLAQLCDGLHAMFADPEFRFRVEDQCRLSVVHRLTACAPDELKQRMQILRDLHAHDLLLQRDTRRFERELAKQELQLQPQEVASAKRGELRALPGVQLAKGEYYAAVVIHQQLLTISKSNTWMVCTRMPQINRLMPTNNVTESTRREWSLREPVTVHVNRGSDPVGIYLGHDPETTGRLILTSPLGGDAYWIIFQATDAHGSLVGFGDDGVEWHWNPSTLTLTRIQNGLPHVIDTHMLTRFLLVKQMGDFREQENMDALPLVRQIANPLVIGNRPFIPYRNSIFSVERDRPVEVTTFSSRILWIEPSMPLTTPRLLVATEHELFVTPARQGGAPEKIFSDASFTCGAFLPGGFLAATTETHMFLFRKGPKAMRLTHQLPLEHPHVVAILSLSAETVGVLYRHGLMQRWSIPS